MNNQRTARRQVRAPQLRFVWLDAALGAAAGAAGVWAMDELGWLMLRTENKQALTRDLKARNSDTAANAGTAAQVRAVRTGAPVGSASVGASRKATQVSGVSPTHQQPGPGAIVFHYALGMLPGALYGVARRVQPTVRAGSGVLYGFALFGIMDETAAPVTGIASPPGRYPWQAHARGLAAHVVLGMTTEILLRTIDRLR